MAVAVVRVGLTAPACLHFESQASAQVLCSAGSGNSWPAPRFVARRAPVAAPRTPHRRQRGPRRRAIDGASACCEGVALARLKHHQGHAPGILDPFEACCSGLGWVRTQSPQGSAPPPRVLCKVVSSGYLSLFPRRVAAKRMGPSSRPSFAVGGAGEGCVGCGGCCWATAVSKGARKRLHGVGAATLACRRPPAKRRADRLVLHPGVTLYTEPQGLGFLRVIRGRGGHHHVQFQNGEAGIRGD